MRQKILQAEWSMRKQKNKTENNQNKEKFEGTKLLKSLSFGESKIP